MLDGSGNARSFHDLAKPAVQGHVELLRKLVRCTVSSGERAKLTALVAAPLIPPPRFLLPRLHWELAPNVRLRALVVAQPPTPPAEVDAAMSKPKARHSPSPWHVGPMARDPGCFS